MNEFNGAEPLIVNVEQAHLDVDGQPPAALFGLNEAGEVENVFYDLRSLLMQMTPPLMMRHTMARVTGDEKMLHECEGARAVLASIKQSMEDLTEQFKRERASADEATAAFADVTSIADLFGEDHPE